MMHLQLENQKRVRNHFRSTTFSDCIGIMEQNVHLENIIAFNIIFGIQVSFPRNNEKVIYGICILPKKTIHRVSEDFLVSALTKAAPQVEKTVNSIRLS